MIILRTEKEHIDKISKYLLGKILEQKQYMLFPITPYLLEFNNKERIVNQNKKFLMNFGEYVANFFPYD